MAITVKDLRKILKFFPPNAPISMHWTPPQKLGEEGKATLLDYQSIRIRIEDEVIRRSDLLYRLGGKKFYMRGEDRIYKDEIQEIIIG